MRGAHSPRSIFSYPSPRSITGGDAPRFIYAKGMPRMIEEAPVINHSDAELTLLEGLVGRTPPFAFSPFGY